MSNFSNKTITNKGLELLSTAMAGGKLEFTRIVMGDGAYSGDIGLIESLVSQKQSLDIKSITRKGSQVVLSTTLLQSAITQDFYWKEVGVYAKGNDDVEILYLYGNANEYSYISKDMLNEKMINIRVLVSNAKNITATINNSLVYLNVEDLEKHNDSEVAHGPLRAWVQGLFNSLQLTWGNITGKPSTFPPSSHGHSASEVTGLPTSLPANGGNADTVDGLHSYQVGTLAASGSPHGISYPAYIKHSVAGDGRFKLCVDSHETRVDYATNADTVDGLHAESFLKTNASCNKNWAWVGQGGQPNWLWGGNDAANMYVYNPSNFSVANSEKLGGYSLEQIKKMCGGDIVGKDYQVEIVSATHAGSSVYATIKSYYNAKGGMIKFADLYSGSGGGSGLTQISNIRLTVDGVIKYEGAFRSFSKVMDTGYSERIIPFDSSFVIEGTAGSTMNMRIEYFLNK